ncbi:hypothetical protein LXL04_038836 [Taraxacum kok-saghyz]
MDCPCGLTPVNFNSVNEGKSVNLQPGTKNANNSNETFSCQKPFDDAANHPAQTFDDSRKTSAFFSGGGQQTLTQGRRTASAFFSGASAFISGDSAFFSGGQTGDMSGGSGDDLDLGINSNFTFITDRQKGLIPAICSRFPHAEHRFCLRHIYQNMKREWKPTIYKDYLWKCATATTIPEFEHFMSEFSSYDKAASEWLKKIPPKQWARSHFTGRAITDILLNNLCEVFNSKLIDGRDKPIIGCLEYIRQYLMKRICNVMKVMDKTTGPLTPTATSILEANTSHASKYKARWNGGDKYQVTGVWQDQHVVDVRNNNCSCRKWELIGIPCKHAIATLNEMTKNSEDVTNIYRWVNKVYWLDTWKEAYSYKVHPIKGRIMWPKSLCPTKLTPPPHHTQVGRPKKKRNKTEDERMSRSQRGSSSQANNQDEGIRVGKDGAKKLTRKYGKVTCSKCKNTGHNARSCTGR